MPTIKFLMVAEIEAKDSEHAQAKLDALRERDAMSGFNNVFLYRITPKEMDFDLGHSGVSIRDVPCKRCGSDLNDDGYCKDETCPHSDYLQRESFTEG